MTENKKESLIRQYAAGESAWSTMRDRGIDNCVKVLVGLGRLGFRPPVAPMEGPNVTVRQRGCVIIREALPQQGR
jgi:hypothetical protein